MKQILLPVSNRIPGLVCAFLLTATTAFAQPTNDDPCDAIPLTVNNSCNFETYTNAGATASSGVPAPGCANYNGGDVWFSVVVPCQGNVVIDTDDDGITDGGMAVYSGDCGNLTLIDCDDDGSSNGLMPYLSLTGLTPGETIYIRIWEYGNDNQGSFNICVTTPPPPGPGGSCLTAQPFCTSNQYTFPNATNVPDGGGSGIYGCLLTTPNPVWYYMQVATPGLIEITIEQTNSSGQGLDVDYIVWGPFSTLQMSCPGLSASNIVSCSYAIDPIEIATIPNAQVGEFYVMLITNYDGDPGTITFQQTAGSGATTCAIICDVAASNTGPVCPGGNFDLNSTTVANGTYTWTGPDCWTSSEQNPTGIPAPTMPGSYTYTVTVVTPAGTSCSASTTVVVGSTVSATSAVTATSCAGADDGTITITPASGGSFTYTLNPGGIVQTNGTFTGLAAGTYSVTFADPTGCTGVINNITVTAGAAPSGTASTTATSCPSATDGTITVSPGGSAPFSFTLNPGNITQASPTFTGLAAGNYTITFTNGSGCTGTINNISVTSGSALSGTAAPSPTSCAGAEDGSITVTPGTPGAYTYTLNPGGITQATPTFTGLATGTYSVTFTDSQGCSGTIDNIVVTAGTSLTGSVSTTQTTCAGAADGTITVTPGTAGTYSYTLNPGAITQASPTFSNLSAGTYSVSYSNSLGCTGTVDNIVVDQGAAITATASTTATSCPTVNDGTITVTPGGTGPYTFTLNPGNIVQASNVFTNLAPGTYTITFVTAAGCTGSVTADPVVSAGPALSSSTNDLHPPCYGINDGSITIVPGGTAPYTFELTGPSGTITQASPVFANLEPGNYSYTFTDALGCQGSGTTTLNMNPPIITPATITDPLCNGGNTGTVIFNTSGGVAPYEYSINGGTTYQTSSTITGLPVGSHTIRIRDNFGCIKDTTVVLSEPALLEASATSTNAGCGGNDGTITITATGGTAPYSYSIDNGANWQSTTSFTVSTGAYNNIIVRDANGCTANTIVTVGLTDNMFLDAGPDVIICAEASHTFDIQTNAETNVFTWTADPSSPVSLDDARIKNPTASPMQPTTYTLTATWGSCSRTEQVFVDVLRKPVPFAGEDVFICQDDSTVLNASVSNTSGTVNYSWSPAASVREPDNATTWVVPGGTTMYIVTVTDNYGCNFSVSDSVLVTMQPPVPAFAGNDTTAILGVPHKLMGSGGTSYTWTPSGVLDDPFVANPMATLTQDTRFTLVVQDFAGCTGYDTVFVKVYEGPTYYVPNAFTPNGDGLNDIFRAIPVGIASTDWFRVFNRYGQVVFETNQWLKGWDGRYQGKDQPVGVYIWIVKGKDRLGRTVEEKGTVTLIR